MTQEPISLEISQGVALITIMREPRRNSLDNEALLRLRDCLEKLRVCDVSTIVITGQGDKAFCAGSDIKALKSYDYPTAQYHTHLFQSVMETIDEFPCATIAAIEGYCLGGGLELALACDYRIASATSEFGFPEIRIGVLPTGGGTVRAPRAIGQLRAREMLMFGERIDAKTALEWGLVSRLAPPGTARAEAMLKATAYAGSVKRSSVALLKLAVMGAYGASARAGQTMAYLADASLLATSPLAGDQPAKKPGEP